MTTAEGSTLLLEDVTKVYGEGDQAVPAVQGASFTARPGELVVIMGPSGSGKSTLLQMCGALLRPTSGRVWLDGAEVTAMSEKQLPHLRLAKLGFVFQAFQLLGNLTAVENVRLVMEAAGRPRSEADGRARELLTELGLGERLDFLPSKLSGGQKQRVAIARALANDPPLILADEPTGNLDSHVGWEVVRLLEAAAKEQGKSVVCVTHDHRIQPLAQRVLWLEDGHLADAPPDPNQGPA
ncbi:MAG TPA: ABC transporter ATP-binding protein [Acidimicrobiales bacterium]|nr:ABC transporter ATP-binding protein [Acidimicrobiales bacterium]